MIKQDFIFVDLQGFKTSTNEFVLKELAIACKKFTQVFLVKPPYPFKSLTSNEMKHVKWIEKHRGIRWSEGYIDYREFSRLIKTYFLNKIIIVKGLEKTKWLQELCDGCKIIDAGEKGFPRLQILHDKYKDDNTIVYCMFHTNCCALKNAICLQKWFIDNNFHSLFITD